MVESLVPLERIARQIFQIRKQNVMLDSDLAALYNVPSIILAHDDGIHKMPNSLVAKFRHFDSKC